MMELIKALRAILDNATDQQLADLGTALEKLPWYGGKAFEGALLKRILRQLESSVDERQAHNADARGITVTVHIRGEEQERIRDRVENVIWLALSDMGGEPMVSVVGDTTGTVAIQETLVEVAS